MYLRQADGRRCRRQFYGPESQRTIEWIPTIAQTLHAPSIPMARTWWPASPHRPRKSQSYPSANYFLGRLLGLLDLRDSTVVGAELDQFGIERHMNSSNIGTVNAVSPC